MLTAIGKQRGMTLVELMIASVISLVVLAGVLTVYSASSLHSSQQLQQAHLHQQLHALMHLMSSDLKRAGYWRFDPDLRAASDNPFQHALNTLRIQHYPQETADSCILFAYDLDEDGLVGVGKCTGTGCPTETDDDNVEQFGFRLRKTRIQSRYGGSGFACDRGYWQAVTDQDIEITQLRFVAHADCSNLSDPDQACTPDEPRLTRRVMEIQLGGQLQNRPDTKLRLSQWVRIRNHQLRERDQ